jgi:DNA-binding LytR/AlgR family response regulator
MKLEIKTISEKETEYIEIGCHKIDDRVNEIVQFVKQRQGSIDAFKDEKMYKILIADILYVESVDDRTFIYLAEECYESRKRLYEFESVLPTRQFARISKTVIVNLMKISYIKPALNGRFLCRLKNGEQVIISRRYVPDIKEKLKR